MDKKTRKAFERMAKFVVVEDNGCTSWTGSKSSDGYGVFWLNGKTRFASRCIWEMVYGPIPKGLQVMHKCDNRECVEITHLLLGTPADNTQDALNKNRLTGPRKIDKEKAEAINTMRSDGVAIADIARELKVSVSTLYNYLKQENKRSGDYASGERHWNYQPKGNEDD